MSKLIKLSLLEPQLPVFTEYRSNSPWINYGKDNLYPDFLISLMNRSAMNKTCIVSKRDAVYGEGLYTTDESKNSILDKANPNESWNDIFLKISFDYILFGGYALNIIWSQTGEYITEIYHVDFSKLRSGRINTETQKIETYYYSSNWEQSRRYKPIPYQSFNKGLALDFPSQILVVADYSPGYHYYPLPDYSGGLNDIQTDVETSLFHISNLANGLNPSLSIQMNNGIPSPEQRQEIYDEITGGFAGAGKAGRFFLTFSPDKDHGTEITPIQSTNDQYYLALETRITSRILTSHRITSPLLLGIRDSGGGLGSNKEEIITAYEHFISTVAKPYTKTLLRTINMLIDNVQGGNGVEVTVKQNVLFDNPTGVVKNNN